MIAAAEAVQATMPEQPKKTTPADERAVVIVDIEDEKTIQSTHSFTMTWNDTESGKVRTGTFTAKRPTLSQYGQIAVLKAKLNGGEKVADDIDFLHEMIASLQIILTEFPDWWKPQDFFDADPLREVWDHVRSWSNSFRNRRLGR